MSAAGEAQGEALFVTTAKDVVGGAEESMLGILKYYPTSGLRPVLVCPPGGEMEARARSLEVAVRPWQPERVPLGLHPRKWPEQRRALSVSLAGLRSALPANKPALVTSHSMEAHVVAAHYSREAKEPVVWHIRDLIPQRGPRVMFRLLEARSQVRPVFVSRATRDHYFGSGSGPVIPDGLDLARFPEPAEPDPQRPVFLYLGQLLPRKGLHWLIEAWALLSPRFPQAVLRIVGTGEAAFVRELKDAASSAGASVEFWGRRTDVDRVLPGCTALVLPSKDEALGLVLLEALVCGVAVITTPEGGMVDVVEDGRTGYLTPHGDPAALARVMQRVLEHPQDARRTAEAGLDLARREFNAERQAARMAEFHASVPAG